MKKKEKEVKKARPSIKDCNYRIGILNDNINWAFRKIKELEEKHVIDLANQRSEYLARINEQTRLFEEDFYVARLEGLSLIHERLDALEKRIAELEKTEGEYKPAWWTATDLKKIRDRKPFWRFW